HYAKEGITSFGECGIAYGWIGHSPIEISAYLRAREEGRLRARAQLMPQADGLHTIAANSADGFGIGLDAGLRTGLGDDLISIGPVKFFMDGALSGETAALRENYTGKDHPGYLQADAGVLRQQILDTCASGWSVAVHAIGDAAVDAAVADIVEAQNRYGRRPVPNRIEHAAMVHDEHLATLAEAGIVVTPQSAFAEGIGDGMNASLGPQRRPLLYRAKSFLDAGVLLAGSSDRPCADGNVLRGIEAFVTRATRDGAGRLHRECGGRDGTGRGQGHAEPREARRLRGPGRPSRAGGGDRDLADPRPRHGPRRGSHPRRPLIRLRAVRPQWEKSRSVST